MKRGTRRDKGREWDDDTIDTASNVDTCSLMILQRTI